MTAQRIDTIYDDGHRTLGTVWKCPCNREFEAWGGHDTTCDCGRDYNAFGQQLAPQSMWEEPWEDE